VSFANEHVVPWSELMKRTLGINVLQCPVCQATMVLLAVITKQEVIDQILTHVKVPSSFSFRVASRELLVATIPRLRRREREPPRSVPLRCSRPRRGAPEGRLRGVSPAVRALIGPERGLKAGWFEKVRWLPNRPVPSPLLVLQPQRRIQLHSLALRHDPLRFPRQQATAINGAATRCGPWRGSRPARAGAAQGAGAAGRAGADGPHGRVIAALPEAQAP